jgi:hypothetical protein
LLPGNLGWAGAPPLQVGGGAMGEGSGVRSGGGPAHSEAITTAPASGYPSAYARFSSAISSFFICSMAVMALCAPADWESLKRSAISVGTTCQDSPYLSFSQPHCWAFSSPPAVSFSQ